MTLRFADFVRTYTWDKRVESFVKEAGLLGGTGKGEPTIVSPTQKATAACFPAF